MTSPHILVLSENPGNARALCGLLTKRPCYPEVVASEADALLRVRGTRHFDLVFLELNGGRYSLRTLESLRSLRPDIDVVIVSAPNETRKIVEAIRLGARDYLTIPVCDKELEQVIRRHGLTRSPEPFTLPRETVEDLGEGKVFVAASAAMQKIRVQAAQLANIDVPVLILGESGSGKEVVARLIHKLSPRWREPFLRVNCAALPGGLLESELFGYEQGAFTGALRTKPGNFESCNRGTILLDEVAEMPAVLQAKLQQGLQNRQFFRQGGGRAIEVDVRILAASNPNIKASLTNCRFREDLYYRLSAFVIEVPPLRDRREEIAALLQLFMARLSAQYSRPPVEFSRSTMDACLRYSWPGNLRELKNFVKRYLVMGEEAIAHGELRAEPGRRQVAMSGSAFQEKNNAPKQDKLTSDDVPTCNLKSMVRGLKDEAEIRAIMQALRETHWNRKRAARLLDISYRGLLYKISQHSLTPDCGRGSSASNSRHDQDILEE